MKKLLILFVSLFITTLSFSQPQPPNLPPNMPPELRARILADYARSMGPQNPQEPITPPQDPNTLPSAPSDPVEAKLLFFAKLSPEEQRQWVAAIRKFAALTPEEREKLKTVSSTKK